DGCAARECRSSGNAYELHVCHARVRSRLRYAERRGGGVLAEMRLAGIVEDVDLNVVPAANEMGVEVEVDAEFLTRVQGVESDLVALHAAVVDEHVVGRTIDDETEVEIAQLLVHRVVHAE